MTLQGVRVGRDVNTDDPVIAAYAHVSRDNLEGEPCSFDGNRAVWSVAGGEVLYCDSCRLNEARENHAFWIDLSVVTNVTISEDDGGIFASVQGWRK